MFIRRFYSHPLWGCRALGTSTKTVSVGRHLSVLCRHYVGIRGLQAPLIDDRSGDPDLPEELREPLQAMDPIEIDQRRGVGDGVSHLDRLTGDDPELRRMIAEESLNAHVARLLYDGRTQATLTQKQLAELVGTQQSTIARLEDLLTMRAGFEWDEFTCSEATYLGSAKQPP